MTTLERARHECRAMVVHISGAITASKAWRARPVLLAAGCAAGLLGGAIEAAAQNADGVIVTSSRLGAAASPYPAMVLPAESLAAHTNLADALTELPDLFVQAPGGRSGNASVFLRGADPNFTAVMIDGVALNNPTNTRGGAVNVSEIGAGEFSRVEIVEGALSSLYGSGSLAGAINLIVPGGALSSQFEIAAGGGTQNDASLFARWRGPIAGGVGASLSASYADDGDETDARFTGRSATAKIANASGDTSALIRFADTRVRAFPDSSGGDQFASLRRLDRRESEEMLLGLRHALIVRDGFRFDISASALSRRDETDSAGVRPSAFDPAGLPASTDHTLYTRVSGAAVARFDALSWRSALGAEALMEKGRNNGRLVFFGFPLSSSYEEQRDTYSLFAETERDFGPLLINLGARVDSIEGLGEHVTGRAGLRHDLGAGFAARLAASAGFKAPSLYALGNPLVGNPALDPESSQSWESGLDWAAESTSASLSLFRTRYEDLIDFVPGPPPRLENRDAVVSQGARVALSHTLSAALTASAQVQYADTRDETTDARLLNRPYWRANYALKWTPTADLALRANIAHVGEREDYAIPTGVVSLSPYAVVAFDASWRLGDVLTVNAALDNALDSAHEDAVGFSAPGRRLRLTLRRVF